jgi:hypothetical protein
LLFIAIVAFIQIYQACRSLIKDRLLNLSNEDEDDEVVLYLSTNRLEILSHCFLHWLFTSLVCWLAYIVFMVSSETIRQALS